MALLTKIFSTFYRSQITSIMTAIIPELKLIYVSIPKCACTSLKTTMYFLEHGKEFRRFDLKYFSTHKVKLVRKLYFKVTRRKKHVHNIYPSVPFSKTANKLKDFNLDEFTKICCIRDPIKRFISAYTNRVSYHKELSEAVMKNCGLESKFANPNFFQFVENFEFYQKINSIKHHTDPLYEFIGEDPSFYDKIYNMEKLNEFSEFLKFTYNIDYKIPRLQLGGSGSQTISINYLKEERSSIYNKLRKITAKDYKIFSNFLESSWNG